MAGKRIQGITIEIGGETTKLQNALKDVDGQLSKTQSALKDVNRLLKLDPSNTELLSQKQKLLKSAIQETEERLKTLKDADKQAKDQLDYGDMGQDKYDALQREIIETEEKLKSLQEEAKKTPTALGASLQEAGKKIQDVGDKVSDVGKGLSTNVTAPLLAVGTVSVKMASDFEDAMAKVSTIADDTEVPMDDLKRAIVDLSNQTGISATEIAGNVYDAISAGQSTGDAVNFVSNSTKLAKAGFAQAGDALDILTTIMNSYGMEAEEVTNVSDMLIQTQNLGKTTVGELSSAMGKVIPTANACGVSLDQLCAGYAIMTSNGVATAESTTYMNSMLNELGKSGTKVSDILKQETGSSFSELMENGYSLSDCLSVIGESASEQGLAFSDMWSSSEAAKAGLILLGESSEDFNKTLAEMQNSVGATEAAFAKMDTSSNKAQKSVNQLKNAGIELGGEIMEAVAPTMEVISDKIQKFSEWFSNLSPKMKDMIVKIGLVAAAIGPVIVVLGTLISSVGTITSAIGSLTSFLGGISGAAGAAGAGLSLFSGPLLPIIGIIAGVVAAGVLLYKNWDTIKEKAGQLKEIVSEKISSMKEKVSEKFSAMKEAATEKISAMKESVSEKISAIKENAVSKYSEMRQNTSEAWSNMKQDMSSTLSGMLSAYKSHGGGLKGTVSAVLTGIKGIYTTQYNAIDTLTGGKLSAIVSKFSTHMEKAKSTVSDSIDKIKGFFNFSWSLPEIKLPHFSISGKFSLNPPSIPHFSVSWYDKAMNEAYVLNGASIFGRLNGKFLGGGETGTEMVMGKQYLINMIQKASEQSNDAVINAVNSIGARMINIMSHYFPQFASNKQLVLDTGTLVGEIAPEMDMQLGRIADHKGRGI